MNLIEIYVQEVTRRLPEKSRDDIALELQSTIEDMLHDEYSEEDVKLALSKLGDPSTLASKYRDRPQYLIGPQFYERYISILRMVMPIAIIVILASFIIGSIVTYQGENHVWAYAISLFGEGIWVVLSTGIQVLFWVTLVFFILERSGVPASHMTQTGQKWQPEDLKNIPLIPRKKRISKGEIFFSLLWTGIWAVVYFNAIDTIGVYEKTNSGGFTRVTTIFNEELLLSFWPVMIGFIGIEIAFAIFKWVSGQWTKKLAVFNLFYHLLTTIFFILIASQAELLNESFITYMSELFDTTFTWMDSLISRIVWASIFVVIITSIVDVVMSFKKAMLRK